MGYMPKFNFILCIESLSHILKVISISFSTFSMSYFALEMTKKKLSWLIKEELL